MDQTNGRRSHSPALKFRVVKEVLTTDSSITDVCKKYGVNSNLYYRWQEQFFEGALGSFEKNRSGPGKGELRRIEELEAQNRRLKDVVAELTAENIDFKKKSWA